MPYRPNPYPPKTNATSLSVLGRKEVGETVKAEFTCRPDGDTQSRIWPRQDQDPEDWPENTGRPGDRRVLLTFDRLSYGNYEVKVTTYKDGATVGTPVCLKFERTSVKILKPEKARVVEVIIESPNNNEEVTGALFFVTGSGTDSLFLASIMVGTELVLGEIVRQPSETESFIVKFENVPAGPGLIFILDIAFGVDSRLVTVI